MVTLSLSQLLNLKVAASQLALLRQIAAFTEQTSETSDNFHCWVNHHLFEKPGFQRSEQLKGFYEHARLFGVCQHAGFWSARDTMGLLDSSPEP